MLMLLSPEGDVTMKHPSSVYPFVRLPAFCLSACLEFFSRTGRRKEFKKKNDQKEIQVLCKTNALNFF